MPSNSSFIVGDWTVEPILGRISRGEEHKTLRPQVMELLIYLAKRGGQVCQSENLLSDLWPNKVISDATLYNCVAELRKQLDEGADSAGGIQTIPKKGYRLLLPVSGLNDAGAVDQPDLLTRATRSASRSQRFIIAGIIALCAGYFLIDKLFDEADVSGRPQAQPSIAVLPFKIMSEDPDQEHFADGLTEELMSSLATLDELRVISQTSSFAFKDRNVPVAEIAAALQVDHILEGSVRRAGNSIRVTVQLIATSTDSHLWSNNYDLELNPDNIFQIQEDIAVNVVTALNLRLFAQDSTILAANGPASLEALDLYHEGMFYLRKIETGQTNFDKSDFKPAIDNFKASIAADPNWAPSHAALGATYHFGAGILGDTDYAKNMHIAKEHIMNAIRIDAGYSRAYGSLGYILTVAGDYDGAMQALDLAPSSNAYTFWTKAILMIGRGRYEDAIDEYRNALDHDPLSTAIRSQLVKAYHCAGRYEAVIEAIESHDEFFKNKLFSIGMKTLLSEAYIRAGNIEKGLQLAVSVAQETGDDLAISAVFALAGQEKRARNILNSHELAATGSHGLAATVAAALGEEDRTLTLLDQAADLALRRARPHFELMRIQCSPEIRNMSGNTRYDALLDRLGLPD